MQDEHTGQSLFHFIEDQIHELIVALECADDWL